MFFLILSYLGMVAFFERGARVGMGLVAKSSSLKISLFFLNSRAEREVNCVQNDSKNYK